MGMQNQETLENKENDIEVDPWEVAFAAVNKEAQKASETTSINGTNIDEAQPGNDTGNATNVSTEDVNAFTNANEFEGENGIQVPNNVGGSDNTGGDVTQQDDGSQDDMPSVSDEEISSYRQSIVDDIEDRTIREVAEAYIKKGARHKNGKLGATIEDSDICRRDDDGVPHFYNPDTGKEFTGDNPRRQAQEWVDDYNKQLASNFNATCRDYSHHLLQEEEPSIAVLEFAPKYDQLDPIRKAMFDNLVEDYEIKNKDNEVIGYSCDLDKALEAVNRQIRSIQAMRKADSNSAQQQQQDTTSAGTGPVLDMKASAGTSNTDKPKFNSLAEAMEYEQDRLIENIRKGN